MNALKHIIVTGALCALALSTLTMCGVAAAQDTKPTERVAEAAAALTEEILADTGAKVLASVLTSSNAPASDTVRTLGRIGEGSDKVTEAVVEAVVGAVVHTAILTPPVAAAAIATDLGKVGYEVAQQARIEHSAANRRPDAEQAAAAALAADLKVHSVAPECRLLVVRSFGYDRDLQVRAISDLGLKDQSRSLSVDECGLAATIIGGQEAAVEVRELGWIGSRRIYEGSVSGLLEGEGRGLQVSIEPWACGSTATIAEIEAILQSHCTQR